ERRCGSKKRRDTGHDLDLHATLFEFFDLLDDSTVERRVARVEPDHFFPGLRMPGNCFDYFVEVHAPAVKFYCRTGFRDQYRVDERACVDQDIGILYEPVPFDRDQLRVTRAGAHEPDFCSRALCRFFYQVSASRTARSCNRSLPGSRHRGKFSYPE